MRSLTPPQVTLSSLATIDEDQEAMQKLNLIIKGDTVGVTAGHGKSEAGHRARPVSSSGPGSS